MRKKISRNELKEQLHRRRFVLPNAVTVGNMFCGFLAIVYSATGRFDKAVISIAFAILLDGLDGRVARKLNATSKFGLELDSLSDAISFGIAPAVLMYFWAFRPLADEFGVFVTFIYALCATSRLARFNITEPNLKGFMGMPTPAAAGFMVAIVNFANPMVTDLTILSVLAAIILIISYLMVCNITFVSIKQFQLKRMRIAGRILLAATIWLLWYDNKVGFLAVASAYVISGPFAAIFKTRKNIISFSDASENIEGDTQDGKRILRLQK